MAVPPRNRYKSRKKSSGARVLLLVLALILVAVVAGYFLLFDSAKKDVAPQKQELFRDKPAVSAVTVPKPAIQRQLSVPTLSHKEQHNYPESTSLPEKEKSAPLVRMSGRLAIIIDDMGGSLSEARSLAAINVPLTFSVIPGLRAGKDVAAFAVAHNVETMIHVPMQSKGWPAQRLEENGLLVAMGADELQERVSGFVQQFPGAVGVNNHMGSEFTEQEEKMSVVLQTLKKNNLFFIDSVTSPASTGLRVAQRLGIKSARRNVFLDNEQERGYIRGQLNQAIRLAKKNGSAIAICHPHPVTIATLAAALPGLAGQGVRLVPVSQLVK